MERRLAAILMTDMVGYSRLMGLDEASAIARQKAHRTEIFAPKISVHGGRIVKTTGDGLLVEFSSVVAAVQCALEVQHAIAEREVDVPQDRRIQYRIGINLGDIVIDGDDILGDGVNVAARLEGLAQPGGICISGIVYDQLTGKLEVAFEDGGEQAVKNVRRPVNVWHWQANQPARESSLRGEQAALTEKPSIAVLPFLNLSGDPEQEFFGDGIAEDVITALSRFRSLFVIARNSSFTYKGRSVDIIQVGGELGVRYVVEGSVRKAGDRVRINAQLIDATSGNHLWADRFDGKLDDIFDLQDQITEQIVIAIEPEIEVRERDRARRKPPESLDAWELLQRGLSHFYRFNETDQTEAIRLFQMAAARDPGFAAAHASLAYALFASLMMGHAVNRSKSISSTQVAAEKAISLDINEPLAHCVLGRLLVLSGEVEMAIGEMETSIAINPSSYTGHFGLGFAYLLGAGLPEKALPHFDTALRLSPRSPLRWGPLMQMGCALRFLGSHDQAILYCRQACQFPDAGFLPHVHLAASLAEAGHNSEARVAIEKATERQPSLSIRFLRESFSGLNESCLNSLFDSLRKAGVPE